MKVASTAKIHFIPIMSTFLWTLLSLSLSLWTSWTQTLSLSFLSLWTSGLTVFTVNRVMLVTLIKRDIFHGDVSVSKAIMLWLYCHLQKNHGAIHNLNYGKREKDECRASANFTISLASLFLSLDLV